MFYSDTQSFLNFFTILNRLEVGVFDRAVNFHSSCIKISTAGQKKHGGGTTRFNTLTKMSGRLNRAVEGEKTGDGTNSNKCTGPR
jgi:hypothetical protein